MYQYAPGRSRAAAAHHAEGPVRPAALAELRHLLRRVRQGRHPHRPRPRGQLPQPRPAPPLAHRRPAQPPARRALPRPGGHAPRLDRRAALPARHPRTAVRRQPAQRRRAHPARPGRAAGVRRAVSGHPALHGAGIRPRARHHRLRRVLRRDPARRHPGTAGQDPHRPHPARQRDHPDAAARHHPAHGPALPRRRPGRRPGLPRSG